MYPFSKLAEKNREECSAKRNRQSPKVRNWQLILPTTNDYRPTTIINDRSYAGCPLSTFSRSSASCFSSRGDDGKASSSTSSMFFT